MLSKQKIKRLIEQVERELIRKGYDPRQTNIQYSVGKRLKRYKERDETLDVRKIIQDVENELNMMWDDRFLRAGLDNKQKLKAFQNTVASSFSGFSTVMVLSKLLRVYEKLEDEFYEEASWFLPFVAGEIGSGGFSGVPSHEEFSGVKWKPLSKKYEKQKIKRNLTPPAFYKYTGDLQGSLFGKKAGQKSIREIFQLKFSFDESGLLDGKDILEALRGIKQSRKNVSRLRTYFLVTVNSDFDNLLRITRLQGKAREKLSRVNDTRPLFPTMNWVYVRVKLLPMLNRMLKEL